MRKNKLTKTFAIFVLVLFSLTPVSFAFNLNHFTQADTVIGDVYDPLSLNRYAYARNNPINRVDPSGNFAIPLLAIPFILGTISAGIDVIHQVGWQDRSLFEGTIDWGSVGKSAGSGAVGGFVAGITSGIVSPLFQGATGIAKIAGSTSTLASAGFTGSAAAQATSNVMNGQPITSNVLEAGISGATWGGAIGMGVGALGRVGSVMGVGARGGSSGGAVGTNLKSIVGISNRNLVSKKPLGMQRNLVSSDIEIVPFKKGMDFGPGKLYGHRNTAIIEMQIDDYTKIQIHHHNLGNGAIDVLPSPYEINPYTGKRIPLSRLLLD